MPYCYQLGIMLRIRRSRSAQQCVGHACSSLSSHRMQTLSMPHAEFAPLVHHVASELQMVFVRCNALALRSFLQMVFVL
ncbi:YGGT family protein, partial [Zea mays]